MLYPIRRQKANSWWKIGGRLVLIEGARYYPQTEMPDNTSPIVLEFLRQV